MKTIGLEEHLVTDDVLAAWRALPPEQQDVTLTRADATIEARLKDLGEGRLAAGAATGLDVQLLSLTAPGVQNLDADVAVPLARATNDLIADTVRARSDRYRGFATLPTPDPEAAARELVRAVTELGLDGAMLFGRTRAVNADHPSMWPIYEAAAHHRAPLYFHPQAPQPAVRDAIYSGFGDVVDGAFATWGLGWHYEVGVQLLRLILSGVFDRFPDLQVVTGHWGEAVLFYLDRIDGLARVAKIERPVSDYFRTNIAITPSGIWSEKYLRWAIETVGVERLMFSTDYPYRYTPDDGARRFLADADLSDADRAAIAHGNWERLVAGIRR